MKRALVLVLICISLFTACGRPDPDILPSTLPKEIPSTLPTPPPPPEPTPVKKPVFNAATAYSQATTLAVDNVRAFALGSALRAGMSVSNETLEALLKAAEVNYPPTKGAWFNNRVYSAGTAKIDPALNGTVYPTNWETWRWMNASIDLRTTIPAAAQSAMAEIFAAQVLRNSGKDAEKYDGAELGVIAAMQLTKLAFTAKSGSVYADIDANNSVMVQPFDFLAQAYMLQAFSRLVPLASVKDYAGEMKKDSSRRFADQIFNQMVSYEKDNPELYTTLSPSALKEVIMAYEAFAPISTKVKWRQLANQHILRLAPILQGRIGADGLAITTNETFLTAQAAVITGLTAAYRATGDESYKTSAILAWAGMKKFWNADTGLFQSSKDAYLYSPALVGDVLQALSAANHHLGLSEQETYATFFTNGIVKSGIAYAQYQQTIEGIPLSADTLRAPAFVSSVQYDPTTQRWTIIDPLFSTTQAMYLAAVMIETAEDPQGVARISDFGLPQIPLEENNSTT